MVVIGGAVVRGGFWGEEERRGRGGRGARGEERRSERRKSTLAQLKLRRSGAECPLLSF